MSEISLELGKYYRRRDGRVVQIAAVWMQKHFYPKSPTGYGNGWNKDGTRRDDGLISNADLIEEVSP